MSVPSMVHRSGDSLIVRSLVSGDPLYDDVDDDDDVAAPCTATDAKDELPDCKVKRNYTCSLCDFFTQNPRVFLYHLRDVHDEKVRIYECPSCRYASRHFQKLLRHTKMVHGSDAAPEPSQDGVRRTRKRQAREDAADVAAVEEDETQEPALFKCSVCDYTSRNQAQLSRHERDEHIKTKFFRCSKCTYVTHIKARYTKHVKYHSMPMIKCDMCDFRTPYKWNLDRHCKNHNGHGAFRCSACNFTADIKQSLTVHEMNHHVPPVGQAAGLGIGRRRNKVGASDTTAAEEAQHGNETKAEPTHRHLPTRSSSEDKKPKAKKPKQDAEVCHPKAFGGSDFINPDDIIQRANGKVYIKSKCKLCNYKTAWDVEMAKHEKKVHNLDRESGSRSTLVRKPPRPIPNLIPIPQQQQQKQFHGLKEAQIPEPSEPAMSQKDINDICAKSGNSVLKDFASLFGSEDVFKTSTPSKVPDLIPASVYNSAPKGSKMVDAFKQKNASFFDDLREKLERGTGGASNLICSICGYESKCLTEHVKHQKTCGKEVSRSRSVVAVYNTSSSRCQHCRQRCKSSADLYNHVQTCPDVLRTRSEIKREIKEEIDTSSEHELKIDEDQTTEDSMEVKPHPMENKVFVWNDILVPMDIEVDDSNYEYTDERVEDNVSLDLSVRTQSPMGSDCSYLQHCDGPEVGSAPRAASHPVSASSDKIPTHGNDISVAQHKRVFRCPHCTFWASTASRFHVHIVGHLNKKPFECSLCAYRSNWRWDITKHIKLKSVRDEAHSTAKVLMTDETGRRNYTKYNKYLTEIPVSGDQTMDTSGGCGTRPKHHDRNSSPASGARESRAARAIGGGQQSPSPGASAAHSGRPPPGLRAAGGGSVAKAVEKKRPSTECKKTLFKCKKCNYRDASRDILLVHVKGHYQNQGNASAAAGASTSAQDFNIRGTSPDKDEASVNNIMGKGGNPPFRCGHCNQVSNWKHVIQRHCRLKHSGDIRVVSNKNGQERIEVEEQTDEPDHVDVAQDGRFKCRHCPYSHDDGDELKSHAEGHSPNADSVFRCHYCKYFVSDRRELVEHLKLHGVLDPEDFLLRVFERGSADGDGKKFRCLTCPYVTNSKSQYTYHKQFHKPRGGQYTCSHCTYNVSKRHLLHQHLKVHGVNVASHKQNGEFIYVDEMTDEIEEVAPLTTDLNVQDFPDIPLVWVSKNGKFSKMFKCRYCPHVNLRKVNIQEHEKMHSVREKNPGSSRSNDMEHRCTECNYICNNAGVLSSHSKVHQGLYGIVHRLVDPSRSDEEQIKELARVASLQNSTDVSVDDTDMSEVSVPEADEADSDLVLYFCKKCPARFLKENELTIHKSLHGLRLIYKCEYCTYTAREKPHLSTHSKVHTNEYQDRTKVLQTMYTTSEEHMQPEVHVLKSNDGDSTWVVSETSGRFRNMETLSSILSKPVRFNQNVPLSGTELFQQKSEAEQKHALQLKESSPPPQRPFDPQFGALMHGNPDFIYPTYLKNGRMKEKRYKCHKCPSAFEKREQYKVHLGLHGSKQRYKCEYCDYSVKYYANYVQHLKKHKMNAEAHAARRSSDDADIDVDESAEATFVSDAVQDDKDDVSKISVADQQMLSIMQMRSVAPCKRVALVEEKKSLRCPFCPYMSVRKDAFDNHQKRHVVVSGIRCSFTCEHCDYSVQQSHILKEHTKLHFVPNKASQLEGFMNCDNMELTSMLEESICTTDEETEGNDNLIFAEHGSKIADKQFSPPLSADVVERFNNNEGEKQYVNVQTGEVVDKNKGY